MPFETFEAFGAFEAFGMDDAENMQCPYEREAIEFSWLLVNVETYSALSENERVTVFSQLELEDGEAADALFVKMEQDGYSLADSVELVRLMELFDYDKAREILAAFPRFETRLSAVSVTKAALALDFEMLNAETLALDFELTTVSALGFDAITPAALAIAPLSATHSEIKTTYDLY